MDVKELRDLNEALKKGDDSAFYSAVVVVSPDRGSFLLAKRKDDGTYTSPAGGSEWGETPRQTAVREVFEEANILISEDMLKDLCVRHLDNGKVCHCFMVILPMLPDNIGPHNDPDKEVKKWKWFSVDEDLPTPIHANRLETYLMARRELAKMQLAEDVLLHMLKSQAVSEELEKGQPRAPIGAISSNGQYRKVAEGKWVHINEGQHTVSVSFKHNGKEYSRDFKVHAPTPDKAWGIVDAQLKRLEEKIGKIDVTRRKVGLAKSYAENELSGTNIDTTHHAMEDLASRNSIWLPRIKELLADFDLADEPREMDLDFPWRLVARQGDDGIYDAYVKNRDPLSGDFGQVVFQVKKMTLPAMIEALKAKEYITEPPPPPPPPAPQEEHDAHGARELIDVLKQNLVGSGNTININFYKGDKLPGGLADKKKPSDFDEDALAEGVEIELEHTDDRSLAREIAMDHLTEDPEYYKKLKTIEKAQLEELEQALEKARPSFPVGTVRTWAGQKYVKHADGWVAVSGNHHGKLMGKFKGEATHKEHADPHHVEVPETSAKTSEDSEKKTSQPKEKPEEKQDSTSAKTSAKEGMRTQAAERLSIRYRGKTRIDGKPSDEPYESPAESTCNLVGFVAFGKAPKKIQKILNQRINEAELILTDMGFKFKTRIDFVCQNMASGKNTQAQYIHRIAQDNPRINICSRDSGITKSLMHEIGHAIDYAMQAGEADKTRGRMQEKLKEGGAQNLDKLFTDLKDVVTSSDYYTQASAKFVKYLQDPTEIFARAFEVYAFERGRKLVEEGKISKDFLEGYLPDVFKTKNEKIQSLRKELEEVNAEWSSTASKMTVAQKRLSEQAREHHGMTLEDLRPGNEKWMENLERFNRTREDSYKTDKEWLELMERYNSLQVQVRTLRNEISAVNDEEGQHVEIPKEKQKEYSSKITTLMDQIFKSDTVKKALESSGLLESLERSDALAGLNDTLKTLI